jgi:heptaprenyl diphosphate synthase
MNEMKRPPYKGGTATKTAYLGLFMALAILMGYVEAIIPVQMPIPGMKLGLPNLVIAAVLYLYSWKEAVIISALRVIVIGFLFGNMFSIAYGLAGALFSLIVMAALRRTAVFSIIGVSAAGGTAHNVAQTAVAFLLVKGFPVRWYLPVLMIAGLIAGTLIGLADALVIQRIRPKALMK